ncbi:DEAD/DEAH box helicase family protein [Haloferax volcanii]|uniref:DNA 3'-5' helicase n=2 Tax=Haloferax volcanii TaxID=2246 RepID=D4H075_HALVD|nr:DEAD/DEAH box helicase family protein [Haloferax volcanii]ADE02850.1 DNA repair helicase Rad25 [Haloferax volcanii DS2]MBS8120854.1 DEAD/DEAH box helicase family protein [Haloferax volcanii]MBS8125891.1 DEAD/DEAH box helicase family protein [Haloferax volcanii]MBS8129744.1 DEAD/DEAH box helicase family protein [Haloferax volcanii]MBS8133609.1 DEAD/DEAH box helicase family protein [Haloferax volcanii]
MRIEFDEGTLLLHDAPETVPHAEWDDRVDTHRAQAYRYRALLKWAGQWSDGGGQATLDSGFSHAVEDAARAYPDLALTPALQIEPRDYQQTALGSWGAHDRQGTVVLPTGSGKTFLGLQAIADAGVSALVVTPTIDLMNQWHATLTHAFGEQLTDEVGVLGGGCHDIGAPTVTTYDSAYRYIDEYGDRFGLLITDETHHLAAETYLQIPEMTLAPYRLGLTATYERADGRETLLEDRMGPVVYEEDVDALAGDFLSEYETIQMSVDLTPAERTEYDEEYQIYRDYVDSHDFDLWKEQGYAEFLKRTSYDPQGRRALVAKQRAERIARTASKKLDTLDNLLKRHHDDRVIVFTANNDFAYDISREFILPCITHQTDTDERTEILDRFRSGEYSMLATSQVLDEGIDVPAANVGIILSGSASKRQYAQRLGRILRPTDDRQPARLYEIITTDTMETYVSQRRREGVSSSADS